MTKDTASSPSASDATNYSSGDGLEEKQQYKVNGKTEVYASAFLTIQRISVPDQEFNVSGYFNVFWRDPDVADLAKGKGIGEWEPPTDTVPWDRANMFDNADRQDMREPPKFIYYPDSHVVHMIYSIAAELKEYMELARFPFDRQFLNMGFTGFREKWVWLSKAPDWVPPSVIEGVTWDAPIHARLSEALQSHYRLYSSHVDYERQPFMRFRFRVERRVGYYIANLVLPMFLIVAICFASFAIPREDIADRLSVSVTMFLAAVAYQYVVSSMLPPTSTVSVLSAYVMTSFTVIGLIVIDNAVAGLLGEVAGPRFDLIACIVLATIWVGVNMFLTVAGFKCCPQCTFRQSWEQVAEDDDSSDFWEYIEESEQHSIHETRRWILCDPDYTTEASEPIPAWNAEEQPLLKTVKQTKAEKSKSVARKGSNVIAGEQELSNLEKQV